MLRHFYDATWGRKPLRRGRASGKQTYSGPLGKADRNGAFSPYGTGNERERGIVSAPLRNTNRERVQGERFYVTIYYVLIKRKENHSRPDALQTGTDFQTAPAPLTTVFERRGGGTWGCEREAFRRIWPMSQTNQQPVLLAVSAPPFWHCGRTVPIPARLEKQTGTEPFLRTAQETNGNGESSPHR